MFKRKLIVALSLVLVIIFNLCACQKDSSEISDESSKKIADYTDEINVDNLIEYIENKTYFETEEDACEVWAYEINEEFELHTEYENYGSQLKGNLAAASKTRYGETYILVFEFESDAKLSMEALEYWENEFSYDDFELIRKGRIVFLGEKETVDLMIEAAESDDFSKFSNHLEKIEKDSNSDNNIANTIEAQHPAIKAVDNFIGENYSTVISNTNYKKHYIFTIVEQPKHNYENGKIFAQSPQAGEPRNAEEVLQVTLYVANNNKKVMVPDLEKENWEQAKRTLEDMGFEVTLVPDINLNYDGGTVIRTVPEGGSEVAEGSKITVYYAKKPTTIAVIDVAGMDVETAKELLESLELKVNVVEENNALKAGTVIRQSPGGGEQLLKGQEVTLIVSNGVSP